MCRCHAHLTHIHICIYIHEQHMATCPDCRSLVKWACLLPRKSWTWRDDAMDEQLFWLPHWLATQNGRGTILAQQSRWHIQVTTVKPIEHKHGDPWPISIVRLDLVASRLKWRLKWEWNENEKNFWHFIEVQAINSRIILMNWWLPSGPSIGWGDIWAAGCGLFTASGASLRSF